MYIELRIKNYLKCLIVFILILLNTNSLFAASITFSSDSNSYRVGDTVRARISVSSDTSVNAVSANISYPADKLSISSISKSGSIISLWAKDPSFSNASGSASLEGVILNGFTGNNGNIVTVVFKAKSEGKAELSFVNATVLANDGNGTPVPLTKTNISIDIIKALPPKVIEEKPVIVPNTPIEKVVEKAKDAVVTVREVEKVNNLPDYSLVIILLLIIIILLILIIIYGIYYTRKLWIVFKKKISKTSNNVLNDLEVLKKDLDDEIIIANKIRKNETLKSEDISFQIKLEKDINNAEEKIVKEIKELEVKE